jgi:hypothetical protein
MNTGWVTLSCGRRARLRSSVGIKEQAPKTGTSGQNELLLQDLAMVQRLLSTVRNFPLGS